jgi:hypothetical protein
VSRGTSGEPEPALARRREVSRRDAEVRRVLPRCVVLLDYDGSWRAIFDNHVPGAAGTESGDDKQAQSEATHGRFLHRSKVGPGGR